MNSCRLSVVGSAIAWVSVRCCALVFEVWLLWSPRRRRTWSRCSAAPLWRGIFSPLGVVSPPTYLPLASKSIARSRCLCKQARRAVRVGAGIPDTYADGPCGYAGLSRPARTRHRLRAARSPRRSTARGGSSSASRTSSGTSSRSARLRSGMTTSVSPAACAASTFCFSPPIGSTRPCRVTSPVIPTVCLTGGR